MMEGYPMENLSDGSMKVLGRSMKVLGGSMKVLGGSMKVLGGLMKVLGGSMKERLPRMSLWGPFGPL